MEIFYFLTNYVQSRLLQNCRMRERVNAVQVESKLPFDQTAMDELIVEGKVTGLVVSEDYR